MKQQVQRIKQHFKNNIDLYVVGSICIVVSAGVTYYFTKNDTALVNNTNKLAGVVNWKTNQIIVSLVDDSTPSKAVGLVGKDGAIEQVFKSIKEAARQTGHHASMISKNVNGHVSDLKGDVFVELQKAA